MKDFIGVFIAALLVAAIVAFQVLMAVGVPVAIVYFVLKMVGVI